LGNSNWEEDISKEMKKEEGAITKGIKEEREG